VEKVLLFAPQLLLQPGEEGLDSQQLSTNQVKNLLIHNNIPTNQVKKVLIYAQQLLIQPGEEGLDSQQPIHQLGEESLDLCTTASPPTR
jgi:hypothetical protein